MSNFKEFSDLIEGNFKEMSKGDLFIVEDNNDELYKNYLDLFPDGTNPLVKERTEHDCSCCKHFVRNLGNVVAIKNGKMTSVWDVEGAPYPYGDIAKSMAEKVREKEVSSVFVGKQSTFGQKFSRYAMDDGTMVRRYHFFGELPSKHLSNRRESDVGNYNTTAKMLKRALLELKEQAFDDVVDLIESKSIYRGEEFLEQVKSFRDILKTYNTLNDDEKKLFAWENCKLGIGRFKNSVIGTLVSDLSSGVSLEDAVRKFESKVAPHNYKRPKALITESMIKKALSDIDDLGLRDSLERRFAKLSDVSVNNVLFADRSSKPHMKDSLQESLMKEVRPKKINEDKVDDISIEEFMSDVLPNSDSVEIMIKNNQKSNFVSITNAAKEDSPLLFNWTNRFAWSYDGNIADSDIKARVKAAGGNVTAPLRFSLSWFNTDDLDIHVTDPKGQHIFYGNKMGKLDVDMNVSCPVRDAVENVCWQDVIDGNYVISVKNFTKRESVDFGFVIETESNGEIQQFNYNKMLGDGKIVKVLDVKVSNGSIVEIKPASNVSGGIMSQEHWGVETEKFNKVSLIMNSPNHWDSNSYGNKHWFFLIDNCKNPEKVRGFYNEFLSPDMSKHRKVMEILAEKTKCEKSDDQLSGLGFSSTKKDSVILKVTGKQNRVFNVQF